MGHPIGRNHVAYHRRGTIAAARHPAFVTIELMNVRVATAEAVPSKEAELDSLEHLVAESHLKSEVIKDELRKMLDEHRGVFALPGNALGRTDQVQHRVKNECSLSLKALCTAPVLAFPQDEG